MADEPRLARIDSDVPKAIIKRMKIKLKYLRIHSLLLLFTFSMCLYLQARLAIIKDGTRGVAGKGNKNNAKKL